MDRQEYIEILLDHYENPRNKHRMEDASVQLGGGNPGCGDLITVYLKINDNERIEEASFVGEGCTISQAGGSIIAEMIDEMGEDVVKSRVRCATLALGTAQAAADAYRRERQRAAEGLAPAAEARTFEN